MKKERTNKVGLVLESAAHPIKEEQQTIVSTVEQYDNGSLSNNQSGSSCKSDSSDLLINVLQQEFEKLDRNFDSLKAELRDLKESGKPTAPVPMNGEQQASATDLANPSSEKLPQKKTLLKSLYEKIPVLGASILILAFLGFNTYFLVSEQQSLYTSMSYSASMALMIALLSEGSLILLSTMASWTSNLEWKLGLMAGMLVMVAVMVGVLDSSAQNRSNTAARQTQEAKNIEKQIATLMALEAPILLRISKLDPHHYRAEISRLSSQLTTPPNGYSYKIEQLSNKLATISTSNADTTKLLWQRRAALFINLLLSAFLGFLWSKNQESVLTKIGKYIGGYWQRTCEV